MRSRPVLDVVNEWIGDSYAAYGIVFALVALDAVFPLVPAEIVLITATVLALEGGLALWLLYPAAVAGAFAGDNASYFLGDKVGEPVIDRIFGSERERRRLGWARRQIEERGVSLVIALRFLPGGRTATTFAAGMLDLSWRTRFLPADAVAAALSVAWVMGVGAAGEQAFAESLWKSVLLSVGISAVLLAVLEGARRLRRRRA